MKKYISLFAAVATVAALASCAKEIAMETPVEGDVTAPEGKTVVFQTTIAKTIIDGSTVKWAEGDSVKLYWIEDQDTVDVVKVTYAHVNATDGTVSAVVGEPKAGTTYYALYPANTTSTLYHGQTGDTLRVAITSSCDGSWAQANQMVACCADPAEPVLNFKHVCNSLKFTVTSTDIDNVEFRSNDDATVAGKFDVQFLGDEIVSLEKNANGAKVIVNIDGPGTYYAPIAPNTMWLAGFSAAEFDGSTIKRYVRTSSPYPFERGVVLDLGTLEEHIPARTGNIFLKPVACGDADGSSWDNAGDSELLRTLLSTYVGTWMLDGCNVYMAEGQYDTWNGMTGSDNICTLASNFKVTSHFYGGYSDSSTGTDISQRDVAAHETVITSTATDKYGRVLYWSGYQCDQTFDGITFKVQDNQNYRGCMYANNGKNEGKLSFINCTWKNANIAAYGAVGQFADFDVLFKDCTIKDNTSTYTNSKAGTNTNGGTVLISNTCNATFDNCLFENNTTHTPGSAILVASGKATIKNCTFRGNSTEKGGFDFALKTANSGQSGTVAIVQYATSFNSGDASTNLNPEVYIDNCIFEGNKSCTCAADIYAYNNVTGRKPLLYINRCYFNGATINGAALKLTEWYQSKCILTENSSSLNAQIQLCIYNCTIGPSTSTVYGSSPTISSHYGDWLMVNTTVVGGGIATLRNNALTTAGRESSFNVYNCAISHTSNTTNTINLSNSTQTVNCGYNIHGNCKNKYQGPAIGSSFKPLPETDGYVLYNDMNWDLTTHAADKYFTFAITPGKEADADRPVVYTTKDDVAAYMAANAPAFDAWLKTIHEDPYAIDIRGEQRNPAQIQKGSWDPGL